MACPVVISSYVHDAVTVKAWKSGQFSTLAKFWH